ncbi:acetate/propionate family kinase [Rhizobium sullae]|uniref:Acetate kinase n=1 Tax=Rhizobium sullae TaxID=50338 RepID=A0A2N0D192_RHISU|nr:acetate/propionate family kinase [Rhizobium sullae]PKA39885.1 acetate kinase [Rhizobium sullae]UWU16248.1 acetate/propionate family kinase [Rhizobium sullae]
MDADTVCLTFNAGSSTLKIGIFDAGTGAARPIGKGKIDFDDGKLVLRYSLGDDRFERPLPGGNGERFAEVIEGTLHHLLAHLPPGSLRLASHRVVHGGLRFHEAAALDARTIGEIDAMVPLAPLHQPQALRVIRALKELRPQIVQTASFDTAFHTTQDDLVRRLAIPRSLHDEGVRRYGFHGLSYKFIASALKRQAPEVAGGRVVAAHLGSGASLCALEGGISRDCSMGFSALDGIPMATRPGWLDPGALLYLMRKGKRDPGELEDFLYHACGLLGVSGISGDTRVLLKDKRPEAAQAIDLYCFRIAGEIGRMAVTLGGLDAVVFTAGVGENQPEIRRRVAAHLRWMGLHLNDSRNEANAAVISAGDSRIAALVIPTDEEQVIADEALAILGAG